MERVEGDAWAQTVKSDPPAAPPAMAKEEAAAGEQALEHHRCTKLPEEALIQCCALTWCWPRRKNWACASGPHLQHLERMLAEEQFKVGYLEVGLACGERGAGHGDG